MLMWFFFKKGLMESFKSERFFRYMERVSNLVKVILGVVFGNKWLGRKLCL